MSSNAATLHDATPEGGPCGSTLAFAPRSVVASVMARSLRPHAPALSFLFVLACGGDDGNGNDELGSFDGPSTSESAGEAEAESTSSQSGSGTDSDPTDTNPTNASESDDGIKFDLGVSDMADTGGDPCGGGGDVEFSHIWIANSPYGTVSKIDTQSLTELARYQVRPQGGGMPSRTSVNVRGDMSWVRARAA
jgi:hypothetical protein